jgi:hypothetical protein
MVLAVTVGAALIRHPVGPLPSTPPGYPAGGTVAAPPVRHPSSASPGRRARHLISPGGTGTLQMDASDHRTITVPHSGRETIRRHRHGSQAGHGHGQGQGDGQGNGNGHGNGHGRGNGQGNGNGNAPVLSILSQPPGEVPP